MTAAAAATAVAPPHDLDAEEYVLGAIMLSPNAIDAVRSILDPADFYRESHGRIYRAALSLHELGLPVDGITVADRLHELGQLHDIGGKERIHEIASLVPATTNVAHHATIVARQATRRVYMHAGEMLIRRAHESADPEELRAAALELLDQRRTVNTEPLELLTHRQVLELELPAERQLVDDLIPVGAVGTIAAVPESHKSWLAQAIAIRVAAGNGWILGKKVVGQGPVAYLWQDDSTREEAERVKAFEQIHEQSADLPVLWGLNLGVQLPRDLQRLHEIAHDNRLALLVLDSYYNFLPGIDLKDDQAEQIVSSLKRDICDTTGCTVLIVDHMPWATDANRQRLRAYGGVFKNAATRFGIYIDAAGDKLHIEARGNNIRGIPKTLAYWDAADLELKLIAGGEVAEEDLKVPPAAIVDWLNENGGEATTTEIRLALDIDIKTLRARHARLSELGVDIIEKRGRATRYVVRDDHTDEQIAMSDAYTDDGDVSARTLGVDPGNDHPGTPRVDTDSQGEPRNHAGLPDTLGDPGNGATPRVGNPVFAGETTLGDPVTPTGCVRTHAHTHPQARARAREDDTNGDALIDDDEIERLAALATADDDLDWTRG